MQRVAAVDQGDQFGGRLRVELGAQQDRVPVELAPGGVSLAVRRESLQHQLARVFVERVQLDERACVVKAIVHGGTGERVAGQQRAGRQSQLAQPQALRREPREAFEPGREPARLDLSEDRVERGALPLVERAGRGALADQPLRLAHVDGDLGREPVPAFEPGDEPLVAELAAQARERDAQVVRAVLLVVDLRPDRFDDRAAAAVPRVYARYSSSSNSFPARRTSRPSTSTRPAKTRTVAPLAWAPRGTSTRVRTNGSRMPYAVRAPAIASAAASSSGDLDPARRVEQRPRRLGALFGDQQHAGGVCEHLDVRVAAAVRFARGGARGGRRRSAVGRVAHPVELPQRDRDRGLETRVGENERRRAPASIPAKPRSIPGVMASSIRAT